MDAYHLRLAGCWVALISEAPNLHQLGGLSASGRDGPDMDRRRGPQIEAIDAAPAEGACAISEATVLRAIGEELVCRWEHLKMFGPFSPACVGDFGVALRDNQGLGGDFGA